MLRAKPTVLMTSYHTRDSVEEEKNRCPIGQSFIYKSTFCGVRSQITTPIIPPDNISFILQAQPVTKNLLSFSHLVRLGFKIDYMDDSRLSFVIKNSDDRLMATAHAERDSDSVYVLQQPNDGAFTGAVITHQGRRTPSNLAQGGETPSKANQSIQRIRMPISDNQRPKPALIDVWHH